LQVCVSLSTPSFNYAMLVTHLVALATIAIVDGTRVSIQGNLAAAKEQEHPVSQFLEEHLKRNQARQNERILSFMASLQEEQLAKTKEFSKTLLQDEEAEATEKRIAETSVPPTTTTTTITTTTTRGQPPAISLHKAARNGDMAALKQHFQAGTDFNGWVSDGYVEKAFTAAHFAASEGHAAALKFLHQAGANLSARTFWALTPAYLAAQRGSAEALEVLAEAGADLDSPNNHGETPTHMAATGGHVAALRVLIKAGVDLNVKDRWGDTPADLAAKKNHQEALKTILEAGGKRNKL